MWGWRYEHEYKFPFESYINLYFVLLCAFSIILFNWKLLFFFIHVFILLPVLYVTKLFSFWISILNIDELCALFIICIRLKLLSNIFIDL